MPKNPEKAKQRELRQERWIHLIYMPLLKHAIRLRYAVFATVLVLLGLSIWALTHIGREFVPTLEEGSIIITANMAPSIGLKQAERVVRNLEQIIRKHPEVTGTVSRIAVRSGIIPHSVICGNSDCP